METLPVRVGSLVYNSTVRLRGIVTEVSTGYWAATVWWEDGVLASHSISDIGGIQWTVEVY